MDSLMLGFLGWVSSASAFFFFWARICARNPNIIKMYIEQDWKTFFRISNAIQNFLHDLLEKTLNFGLVKKWAEIYQ